MKSISFFFGLLLVLTLSFTVIASSASANARDLRTDSNELLENLSSKAEINSNDIKHIEKHLNKLLKPFEKRTLSSKSSVSIGDLKEAFDKYSEKIRKSVSELESCSAENQIVASSLIEEYFEELKENFGLSEKVSQEDDVLIEALRRYPAGSIASKYTELWNTLNNLGTQNLSAQELMVFIDSAMLTFSKDFTESTRQEFAAEMGNERIAQCMFSGIGGSFNTAMDKIQETLTDSSLEFADEAEKNKSEKS